MDIVYDWQLRAEKPLLRDLSFVLRPLFEANHRWAMARGETSLRLELERRRATSAQGAGKDSAAARTGDLRGGGVDWRRGGRGRRAGVLHDQGAAAGVSAF